MYIFWKSWIPWCTPWIEIILHCLQRCTYSGNHEYHDVRRELKLYTPRYSKWIQWYTSVFHCLQRYDDFTMVIAISVDWNYISIVSRDVMMNYYIPWKSLTSEYHDVRRGLKIIHTTISKVNTTVIQWYTSVYRLSPEMWWWITTFLEKVWQVHTMMYTVDWNYIPRYSKWIQWYSFVYRMSPGMWWITTFLESLTVVYHDVHRG